MSRTQQLIDEMLATGYKYQQFEYDAHGIHPGDKCSLKLQAWGDTFPSNMDGLLILDVGSNLGFFSFLAAQRGASVIAIEKDPKRLRWCKEFKAAALSEFSHEWMTRVNFYDALPAVQKKFDIILLWSVYHHIYNQIRDHNLHFYFFRNALEKSGRLLFEGPFDPDYIIERLGLKDLWSRLSLEVALGEHFHWRYVGPALHVEGRECVEAWPR